MLADAVINRIVSKYAHGTAFQRWHMRGRLRLCPYDMLLKHLRGPANILDIGCGFGHLAWYLETVRPDLAYFGTDIDSRKIDLAQACPPGDLKPVFRAGEVREMTDLPAYFGNIVILDVLYLLPWEAQIGMLEWCAAKLDSHPASSIVIKTMEAAKGWVGFRTVAEEWIMVHLLHRTRSSGTINGAKSYQEYEKLAHTLGLRFELEILPTWNPSAIFRFYR